MRDERFGPLGNRARSKLGLQSIPSDTTDMAELKVHNLLDQLIRLEGDRLAFYRDAEGNLIVSGRYVEPGVGRERPTTLEEDVQGVAQELEDRWPVAQLDSARQQVLIHMAFNVEVSGLLAMKRFVWAVESRAWDTVAEEMLLSQWGQQDKVRARALAGMMLTGG